MPINENLATAQEVQQEQQSRQDDFMRAIEMANNIIDRNPDVLAYYWYMWSFRDRLDVAQIPTEQVTHRMIKQMTIPTDEEQLTLRQHLELFEADVWNEKLIRNNKVLYAYTYPYSIKISLHCFNIDNYNARILFIAATILHELVHVFEPYDVDLQDNEKLFCEIFHAESLSTDSAKITYAQDDGS